MRLVLTVLIAALLASCTPTPQQPWTALAACESTSRWSLVDPPYSGGLQFVQSTWDAYGGRVFAPHANEARRSEQIAVAINVQHGQGWGAWPVCSRKLGLR